MWNTCESSGIVCCRYSKVVFRPRPVMIAMHDVTRAIVETTTRTDWPGQQTRREKKRRFIMIIQTRQEVKIRCTRYSTPHPRFYYEQKLVCRFCHVTCYCGNLHQTRSFARKHIGNVGSASAVRLSCNRPCPSHRGRVLSCAWA